MRFLRILMSSVLQTYSNTCSIRAHVSATTKLINNHRVVYTTLVCIHRGVNYGGGRRKIVDGVNGTRIEKSMRL